MLSYLDPCLFPDNVEIYQTHNDKLVYPIFKNGYSNISRSGFDLITVDEINQRPINVYLREPFERYVKGIQEFLVLNPNLDRATSLEYIQNYIFLDRHFALQFHWLVNLARHVGTEQLIQLNDIKQLNHIITEQIDLNSRNLDNEIVQRFIAHEKLNYYLTLDKILYHDLVGKTLTFKQIMSFIKLYYSDLYKEVIERSKNICTVLD